MANDGNPAAAGSARRRLLGWAAVLLVAVGLIWGGWHWFSVARFMESTDDAYVGGEVTSISPKVAGNIVRVMVTDNQIVHAGQLLVQLDPRDYQVALDRADAAVKAQQAALANLDATRQLQLSVIDEAGAGIVSSAAETVRSRDDRLRYQNLSATAAVSVQSFQKADADYKQAVANAQKTKAALVSARRQLDVIATQKQQAAAMLAQAVAQRELAVLNLGYTTLRAPVDGVVGNRRARLGAYATIGMQLLAVVPAKGLWIDANFKESQLVHIRPGMAVQIHADALPGQTYTGHVLSLAPATGAQFSILPAENATGNFTKIVQRVPVRVQLDGEGGTFGALRPGLSVTAEVDGRTGAS